MPRTEYQHFINIISSETIAEPRFRWLFLRTFHTSKIGWGSIPWPGGRIYDSTIGDHVALGMGAIVEDSTIGDDTVICAKAEVRDAVIGRECFISANARVSGTIPDRTFVSGTNRCRKRDFTPKPTLRRIEKIEFEGYPVWDWEAVLKCLGIRKMLSLIMQHFYTNSIAQTCKSNRAKRMLSGLYCNVEEDSFIHHSAVLDSIFPRNVYIKKGAYIDKNTLVLTHSFVNESGYVLEKGITTVGENSRLRADSLVLPGVTIPDNVDIPESSLVAVSGPFLVKENVKLKWDDVRK